MASTGIELYLSERSISLISTDEGTSGEVSVQSASIGTMPFFATASPTSGVLMATAKFHLQVGHHSAVKSISTVLPCELCCASDARENGCQGIVCGLGTSMVKDKS